METIVAIIDWLASSNRAATVVKVFAVGAVQIAMAIALFKFKRQTAEANKDTAMTRKDIADIKRDNMEIRADISKMKQGTERARAEMSLNVDLTRTIFHDGDDTILELTTSIHNPTNRTWSIVGGYISARALIGSRDGQVIELSGKENFDDLPPCGHLSEPINKACLKRSILSVGPDETERLIQYHRLSADFCARYPVVVFEAEVYAANPMITSDRFRERWIELANEAEQHKDGSFKLFDRLAYGTQSVVPGLKPGDRCLMKRDDSAAEKKSVDIEATVKFLEFMNDNNSLGEWTRYLSVNIRAQRPTTS